MPRTILIYESRAYASELDLFRETHVPASRAVAISVVGRTPAMIFCVRQDGRETFLPDLGDVYRITRGDPAANVQVIPVHGQSRLAH